MTKETPYFTKTVFIAACLTLGGSGIGALGCGSDGGEGGATVDSQLFGIYLITQYQSSEEGCDNPADTDPPNDYLALYNHVTDENPDEPLLLGRFCGSVEGCRSEVVNFPELLSPGYAFSEGSDDTGWFGWAIPSGGPANDQCRADVQIHELTQSGADAVMIETEMVETTFPPELDGNEATCTRAAALASLNPDLPCLGLIVVEGNYEAGL
jgi:hypothetical protein